MWTGNREPAQDVLKDRVLAAVVLVRRTASVHEARNLPEH